MLDFAFVCDNSYITYYCQSHIVRAYILCILCFLKYNRVQAVAIEIVKFQSQKISIIKNFFLFTLEFICIPIFFFEMWLFFFMSIKSVNSFREDMKTIPFVITCCLISKISFIFVTDTFIIILNDWWDQAF